MLGPVIPKAALQALSTDTARPTRVERRPFDQSTRRAPRVQAGADLRITVPAGPGHPERHFSAVTRDLSETGMFFFSEEKLPVGTRVQLCIELSGMEGWNVEEFHLRGVLVRSPGDALGIDFEDPPERFRQRVRDLMSS